MPSNDSALVLSGGGARAAYQVGVLRALGELLPTLRFSIITGVSAGAINTTSLAAHPGSLSEAAEDLANSWRRLTADQVYRVPHARSIRGVLRLIRHTLTAHRTGDPALRGLLSMEPLRRFLRSAIALDGIAANVASGRLRAAALSATSYTTGWTVTFVQGAPEVPMWTRAQRMAVPTEITFEHVLASAAIPIVFPAVHLNGEYYGDGSVRQAAPLAPAIHLGARRIVAIGMRSVRPASVSVSGEAEYPSSAEVFGLLLNSVFLDSLDVDAERLERINRLVEAMPPGSSAPASLQRVDLLVLRPSRDLGAMSRDYPMRFPWTVSFFIRAMGAHRTRGADFLSYLLFNPSFAEDLMQLGYEDTYARRRAVEAFCTRMSP